MKDKHHKHPPLTRPRLGMYHRMEWAIYGTTCGEVESFYQSIEYHFQDKYLLSYVDADHSDDEHGTTLQIGKKQYTQKTANTPNRFDDLLNVQTAQAVFVNGNHFPAQRQIVIVNPDKKESLRRRVEQLDRVDLVLLPTEDAEVYDFLQERMDEQTRELMLEDREAIYQFLETAISASIPKLKALILAGGKSQRMKEDKSQLQYHGLPQEEHLAQLCHKLGIETFISKSSKTEQNQIGSFPVIKDRFVDMGPFGAILSAFMHDPESAWLVIACDLPYLTRQTISDLLEARSIRDMATAFRLAENPFPEPLIAIYEPEIYRRMLSFMTLGYACPRKVLINSQIKEVILEDGKVAFNANTPAEKEAVWKDLKSKD